MLLEAYKTALPTMLAAIHSLFSSLLRCCAMSKAHQKAPYTLCMGLQSTTLTVANLQP